MSVFRYNGLFRYVSKGLQGAVNIQLDLLDLRPVKKITYSFDPFSPNAVDFRKLMFCLSIPKVRQTNHKCIFKTEVLSDRSPAELLCNLENGQNVLFKAENLTTLQVLQQLNIILGPLIPPKEVVPVPPRKKLGGVHWGFQTHARRPWGQ